MESDQNLIKERIKSIAKLRGKSLKDIYKHIGISQVAFDKSFLSKNFPYSKKINDIADFLEVSVEELTGEAKLEPNVIKNEVNDLIESYYKKNPAIDEKTLLHVMKSENLLLKQIIERQEKEIEFLRGQFKNKG